ncbi:MAG: hypothetical protein JXB05_12045 [Myxococcaceae bacterium]|nr:hypothetical protein [Myxococcaceae bacterium]
MGMPMMAAEASVEEVPGGARMVLKAKDPSGVDALRQQVHQHAEMMSKGRCGCPAVRGAQGPQDSGS